MSQPTQPATATPAAAHPRELLARARHELRRILRFERMTYVVWEKLNAVDLLLLDAQAEARHASAPACEPDKPESLSSDEPTKPALHAQDREALREMRACLEAGGLLKHSWRESLNHLLAGQVDNPPRG